MISPLLLFLPFLNGALDAAMTVICELVTVTAVVSELW